MAIDRCNHKLDDKAIFRAVSGTTFQGSGSHGSHPRTARTTSSDNIDPQMNRVSTFYKPSSGWWFGTFFIFPYIVNNHPN